MESHPILIPTIAFDAAAAKRASDRVHQRHSRARKKSRIVELEQRNASLTSQLETVEKSFERLQDHYNALRTVVNAAYAILHRRGHHVSPAKSPRSPDISSGTNIRDLPRRPTDLAGFKSAYSVSPQSLPADLDLSKNDFPDLPLELGSDQAIMNSPCVISSTNQFDKLQGAHFWGSTPDFAYDEFTPNSIAARFEDCATPRRDEMSMEYQRRFSPPPVVSDWAITAQLYPMHLPPTTPTDQVLLEVTEFGRQWSLHKGSHYAELFLPNYPCISSMLRPTSNDAATNPISSAVGKHAKWATSVHSLASRVAYHYMVGQMIRWMVCRSEQSYNQLPKFLRPTLLQRMVPHPPWVDIFPW